ncbi:cytochrome c oxidase assembly protein PET191-domain-containing protein [Crassisporium funariophilum]|nr:cytochrome c oxidase assembly protein PET191-domain-containing protein [Crassisporium funariophilum]
MASSCQNLILALKDCLKHSDCVRKQGHLPSECLKEHFSELPEECQSLRKATFDCKRGMVRHPLENSACKPNSTGVAGHEEAISRKYCWIPV